jgi:acetyl-CoA carboxylase carboxyltransferase component
MLPQDPDEIKAEKVAPFTPSEGKQEYEARDLIRSIIDTDSMAEYKREYGQSIITTFGLLGSIPVGLVANQRLAITNAKGQIEIGGVLYAESADKIARFVLECNQMQVPLIFIQDVMGFMVGKEAEMSGIIRSGAKLVNAISNSIVPKITCIVGNSFGAGHYALCGKAYDPNFILAWPSAKYAVMGAEQARATLHAVQTEKTENVEEAYQQQMDIRYAAARGWVDAIIAPETTREVLLKLLPLVKRRSIKERSFHTGVIQT